MSKIREYTGDGIVVQYDAKRCIHAAECVRGLPAVFDVEKRPWIQPDNATPTELIEVVQRCPTGALQYVRGNEVGEESPTINVVLPMTDGPVYVSGDITITLPDGSTAHETRLALCRCGASENKPFCDNSHKKIEFSAARGVSAGNDEETAVSTPNPLTITPLQDGPCLLTGNFAIHDNEGNKLFSGEKSALCRCGGSQNKPFCDGQHKVIGFSSD